MSQLSLLSLIIISKLTRFVLYSCKKLKPTWDTLGERFSNVKSKLTVAKFDATENDVPASAGFKVSGFPTIKFKAAGSKEWISYEGDRSLDSLVEFLEANATNDISAPDDLEAELEGESTIKSERHDELVRPLSLSSFPFHFDDSLFTCSKRLFLESQ